MVVDPNSLSPENFLLGPPNLSEGDLLLIASQSCDIVHPEPDEPFVELHVARKIAAVNGLYVHARNPRKLHFQCSCTPNHSYEISAKDRNLVRKSDFRKAQPSKSCMIEQSAIQDIAYWTGRRYFRLALPDAFNKRITSPRKTRIKRLLEQHGGRIHSIYFILDPETELPDGDKYELDIIATVDPHIWSESQEELRTFGTQLAAEFECDGIHVNDAQTLPLDEVDLYTISHAVRFDSFDYLTLEEGEDVVDQR